MKFPQAPSDLHDDTTKPMKLLDDHEPRTHVRQFAQCPAAGHGIAVSPKEKHGFPVIWTMLVPTRIVDTL